jgi:hypothetical protein
MIDRKMKGLVPKPDKCEDYDSVIELSEANYKLYTSSAWFTLGEDGKARVKNKAELKVKSDEEARGIAKQEAKQIRSEALLSCTSELNGHVFQTRPSDEPNFRLAIAGMEDGDKEEWILENDTVVEVSKAELFEVLSMGLQAVKKIYSDYKEVLKAL